ncbi:MAG: HU family DNA-binding protein [bacterium]|nr:HU family DNA-binding protein [bacterium]
MTKHDLVESLSKETGYSKKEVEACLKTLTSIITDKVRNGEKVAITGFGTFDLGKRASRRGRNPQNGDYITIPEMKMPRFRAGKNLKEAVR